jgi:hypothetical protein
VRDQFGRIEPKLLVSNYIWAISHLPESRLRPTNVNGFDTLKGRVMWRLPRFKDLLAQLFVGVRSRGLAQPSLLLDVG